MRKNDFPIFKEWKNKGKALAYLDSASTTFMPECVIEAMSEYERTSRANVHRGIYELSEKSSDAYDRAREQVAVFLHAASSKEVVFTRNTTEGINLVAYSLAKDFFSEGDHVLISRAEHHSNLLPWQMLCEEKGVCLDILDIGEDGTISLKKLTDMLHPRTKFAALVHASHVLGAINPVKEIAAVLRTKGILFLADAAQSAGHMPIDVQDMGCDFLVFSGHKMGGPMGIGVLYGREEVLKELPPFLRGGGMIRDVTAHGARWDEEPYKFEAGTPNVSGAVGLAKAVEYIASVGFEAIRAIDENLTRLLFKKLESVEGACVYGPKDPSKRGGVVSFTLESVHPHDLATILDRNNVCIRAGHHCAMPLMQYLGVSAMSRASFWMYNTEEDVEKLVEGVKKAIKIFEK